MFSVIHETLPSLYGCDEFHLPGYRRMLAFEAMHVQNVFLCESYDLHCARRKVVRFG